MWFAYKHSHLHIRATRSDVESEIQVINVLEFAVYLFIYIRVVEINTLTRDD